jgi:UDP-glucuronate decarboxylase
MIELANLIIELTHSKSKLVYLPLPADDPTQRQPNIDLARKELGGWEPKTPLKEGLIKTITYFDQILKKQ